MTISLLIAGSTFLALGSLAVWAFGGVARPADARLRALALGGHERDDLASVPFEQRVIVPAIEAVGRRLAALLPGAVVLRTEQRLVLAGQPMRAAGFFSLVAGLGALLAGTYVALLLAATNGTPPAAALPLAPLLALLGAFLPVFWLSSQARTRQRAILRGLPDSMDLVTICVEAGLGLEGAFQQVVEKQSGPLVDEIRQMMREIGVGKTRRQALLDLADRVDLDDMRGFANAVIQADQMGTSLAQVLRVQSQSMRVRRRQRAEEEARKAPVKMVFPLVFCLMPSLFIFILGPIIVSVIDFLSST
ncbi:MAG: type II secretion system F family protein [Dehalococcoidia bacterium]